MSVVQIPFELPEQQLFAKLSGDYNPMHLDAVLARRFMFGGIVVHGVHLLLKALELLFSKRRKNISLRTVSAQFHHPVHVGSLTDYVFKELGESETSVQIRVGISPLADIHVSWNFDCTKGVQPASELPTKEPCQILVENDVRVARGRVPALLHTGLSADLFPALSKYACAHQIAVLLAATRIIGMKCPGQNSIFSELTIRYSGGCEETSDISFVVEDYDPRFRLASLQVTGLGSTGTLKAFLRPPPQVQPLVSDLEQVVGSNEFEDRRALVIGGSRGLGELSAKLLAAGGADVRLTYRTGEHDAACIVNDIINCGGSAAAFKELPGKGVTSWPLPYPATPALLRMRLWTEKPECRHWRMRWARSVARVPSSRRKLSTLWRSASQRVSSGSGGNGRNVPDGRNTPSATKAWITSDMWDRAQSLLDALEPTARYPGKYAGNSGGSVTGLKPASALT